MRSRFLPGATEADSKWLWSRSRNTLNFVESEIGCRVHWEAFILKPAKYNSDRNRFLVRFTPKSSRTADDMPTFQKPWTSSTQVSLLPCKFQCKSYQNSIPFTVVLGWLQYKGFPEHPTSDFSLDKICQQTAMATIAILKSPPSLQQESDSACATPPKSVFGEGLHCNLIILCNH